MIDFIFSKKHGHIIPLLLIILFWLFPYNSSAAEKDSQSGIAIILSEAGEQYLEPVMLSLSAGLNSGWSSSIPAPEKLDFTFGLSIGGVGTWLGDGLQNISVTGQYYLSRSMAEEFTESLADQPDIRTQVIDQLLNQGVKISIEGGTAVGNNEIIRLRYGEKDEINFPVKHKDYPMTVNATLDTDPVEIKAGGVLAGIPMLPAAFPQLKLGTLYGTQLILRGMPGIKINDDVGSFKFFGLGIMHNPMAWFNKKLPFQIGIGGMYQHFSLEDHLKITTKSFMAMTGYNAKLNNIFSLTPQLGIITDATKLKIDYKKSIDTPGGEEEVFIDISLEENLAVRTFVGLQLKLSFVNIYGRYFITGQQGAGAGIEVSF